MTIAHDAVSLSAEIVTNTASWTHTPVGTPRGVLVMLTAVADDTDRNAVVTYGGVTMTEVPRSPIHGVMSTDPDHMLYGFFLGTGIPTGAQTVEITVDTIVVRNWAAAVTLTAAADTDLEDAIPAEGDTTNPSLGLKIGHTSQVYGMIASGADTNADITSGSGYTLLGQHDAGASNISWISRNSTTAADASVLWSTTGSQTYTIFAFAVHEGTSYNILSATELTQGSSGSDATSYTTAAFTPTPGKMVLAFMLHGRDSAEPSAPTSLAGHDGLYLTGMGVLETVLFNTVGTSRLRLGAYLGFALTATSDTITFDWGAETQNCCYWYICEIANMDATRRGTGVYSIGLGRGDAGNVYGMNLVLSNTHIDSGARWIGIFAHNANVAMTQQLYWTELVDRTGTSPSVGLEAAQLFGSGTTALPPAATPASGSHDWAGLGLEIMATQSVATTRPTILVNSGSAAVQRASNW